MPLQLEIVTPERQAYSDLVDAVYCPGTEGEFGVLPHHAPLLSMTKAQIVLEAVRLGVDPARTLSCYAPGEDGSPCGECDSCRLRAKGFREAGLRDPAI